MAGVAEVAIPRPDGGPQRGTAVRRKGRRTGVNSPLARSVAAPWCNGRHILHCTLIRMPKPHPITLDHTQIALRGDGVTVYDLAHDAGVR